MNINFPWVRMVGPRAAICGAVPHWQDFPPGPGQGTASCSGFPGTVRIPTFPSEAPEPRPPAVTAELELKPGLLTFKPRVLSLTFDAFK